MCGRKYGNKKEDEYMVKSWGVKGDTVSEMTGMERLAEGELWDEASGEACWGKMGGRTRLIKEENNSRRRVTSIPQAKLSHILKNMCVRTNY